MLIASGNFLLINDDKINIYRE